MRNEHCLDPGELRHRVTIQERNETTTNDYNEVVPSWDTYAVRWGKVEPVSGREYLQNLQVDADLTHRVHLPSDATTRAIKPKMRIQFTADGTTRTLEIVRAFDVGENKQRMEVLCREPV